LEQPVQSEGNLGCPQTLQSQMAVFSKNKIIYCGYENCGNRILSCIWRFAVSQLFLLKLQLEIEIIEGGLRKTTVVKAKIGF
jgi:hypothetical protein